MIRNTLKRVMGGLVLIDHETGAVFDRMNARDGWHLVTKPSLISLLTDGFPKAVIGQNVTFK